MKKFNIKGTRVKIDVAAIEWPANATTLAHENSALVCRTQHGPDIRIPCDVSQVTGDIAQLQPLKDMTELILTATAVFGTFDLVGR